MSGRIFGSSLVALVVVTVAASSVLAGGDVSPSSGASAATSPADSVIVCPAASGLSDVPVSTARGLGSELLPAA